MSLTGETAPEISSKIGVRPMAATIEIDEDNADIVNESIYPFLVDPLRKFNTTETKDTLNVGKIISAAELLFALFLPDNEAETTIPAKDVMNISESNE